MGQGLQHDDELLVDATDGLDAPPTGIAVYRDGDALRHQQRRRYPTHQWQSMALPSILRVGISHDRLLPVPL